MSFFVSKFNKLKKDLAKKKFLKNVITLAGATSLGQIISISASFVLTRLYTPEDFGTLAIFTSITSQFLVFVCFRYEWAIPLPKSDKKAFDLLILCLITNCIVTLISILIILFLGSQIINWMKVPKLENYLWGLPFILFFAGCYQIFNYWALRKQDFKIIANTKLIKTIWTVIIQISVGLLSTGFLGLLIGTFVNSVVGTIKLVLSFSSFIKKELSNFSLSRITKIAVEYSKFPRFSVWSSFFNSAGLTAPTMLLAFFYDSQSVGSFSLAQRVISIPATLIGSSISQVFLANGASLIRDNPKKLKLLQLKTFFILLSISFIVGISLIFSPWSFPILFGEEWQQSGFMVRNMTLMFIASMSISSLSMLEWLEKQDWMLGWNLARLLIIYLGFLLAHMFHLSVNDAIALFSVIMTIMYIFLMIMNIKAINLIIARKTIQ